MTKTFGDYVVLIISLIGGFASIVAFGIYFAPRLNSQGWIGVFFLGTIALFFLGYNYYLISKYRKKVRYADIHEELNMGFASLHSIDRMNSESISQIGQHLIDLCDSISNAFSKVNGNHIGACVKFLTIDGDRPRALTLVRDRKSSTKNRKTGRTDKTKHWIDSNSDFDFIYSNFDNENIDTTYYLATKLPCKSDYRNSRLKDWPPKTKLFLLNNVLRQKLWPLPYKSTLVVPIVPLFANEQEQAAIRGFLCIDSSKNVAFTKTIDVEILKGISDALYNKIDKLHELLEINDEKN